MGNDVVIAQACAAGNLELNAFLPIVTANLLDSIGLLSTGCDILRRHCVEGITADEEKCKQYVENSTAVATALLPVLGYDKCSEVAKQAGEQGKTIRKFVTEQNLITHDEFDQLTSPEAVCQLGFRQAKQ